MRTPGVCAVAALVALIGGQAAAAPLKLVCRNGFREYLVVFEPKTKSFRLNPDTDAVVYKVKSVSQSEDGLVVRGRTVPGGPSFEAFFGDGAAIAYKAKGLDQVDLCRHI